MEKKLLKTGAICALAAVLFWVIFAFSLFVVQGAQSGAQGTVQQYQAVQGVRVENALLTWSGLAASLLMLPAIYSFYRAGRRENPLLWFAMVASVLGLLLLILSFVIFRFAITYFMKAAVLGANESTFVSLVISNAVLVWMQSNVERMGWLIGAGLGVGLFGLLAHRFSFVPRAISWSGVFIGVMGIGWILRYLPVGIPAWLLYSTYINAIGAVLWYAAMAAAVLLKTATTVESADPPG